MHTAGHLIKSLLEFGLTRSAIIVLGLVVFCAAGLVAFSKLNIEAYPNPAPVILEITAQAAGLSAEEMEKYYTIPMEVGLYPTPGVVNIRSTSFYGLSFVRVTFKYGVDFYFALTQASISLQQNVNLPGNQVAQIQQSSLVGEIYRYQLVGPPHFGLTNLRTLQDYVVTRRFLTIPGVVQINAWGGTTKQFNVDADLQKLEAYNITIPQLITALGNANINVGGREITIGQQSVNIRGVGLVDSGGADDVTKGYKVQDIENVVLTQSNGLPIQVKDVANVSVGYVPRLGIGGRDHEDDVATAIVVMGRTQHTNDIIPKVQAEVAEAELRRQPAAGRQDRSLLRSQLAGRGHHAHGAAQPDFRLPAGFPDSVGLSRRPAQRDHRQRQHPVRAVLRDHHSGAAGRGRQPAVARRGRFRHHRRFRRDHDGEHLSEFSVLRRKPADACFSISQRAIGGPIPPRRMPDRRARRTGPSGCA